MLLFMTKAQYKPQTLLVLTEFSESPQKQNWSEYMQAWQTDRQRERERDRQRERKKVVIIW